MKVNFLFKVLTIIFVMVGLTTTAQVSFTGQIKIDVPSILSACSSDTIFFELTNLEGASCPVRASNVQFLVTLPDTVKMTCQAVSVGSMPAAATVCQVPDTLSKTFKLNRRYFKSIFDRLLIVSVLYKWNYFGEISG